jgi:hypothetical protein
VRRIAWKFINSPTGRRLMRRDGQAAHAQIGQQLRLVRREQPGNGLDLQDDGVRDKYVGAEAQRYLHAFVEDWDADLAQ